MRVLAIDGGGIRGLIPALVLAEIEERTGRRTADLFDLIAGTSTGAIIACALARPDPQPASAVVEIYLGEGPQIFHRSLLRRLLTVDGYLHPRYGSRGLATSLRRHLGAVRLGEATTGVLVTTYDLESRQAVLLRRADDVAMVDAAHASSAAPSYFAPFRLGARTLVDGGVGAVNPAALGYAEAGGDVTVLASLGTGELTRPYHYRTARHWGMLQWARPALDVVFDAGSDFVALELTRLLGGAYVRVQTRLVHASDALDDASPDNLRLLREAATALIRDESAAIDRICALATA